MAHKYCCIFIVYFRWPGGWVAGSGDVVPTTGKAAAAKAKAKAPSNSY